MPSDLAPLAIHDDAGDAAGPSNDRKPLVAFVADGETEKALREGLAEAMPGRLDIRRGGIGVAIATLRKSATPRVLIVDIGGEDEPLTALDRLSDVTEPDVTVLVIGDARDVDFYRQVTRGLGVADYLPKPVTRDVVARLFAPVVRGEAHEPETVAGGRAVSITGANGGAGASTIAVNLAWHFAAAHRRHTCLLDANLHFGTAGLLLDTPLGAGLRAALQAPDRMDRLFLERAAQPVGAEETDGRLSVLASEESLAQDVEYTEGAAGTLLDLMSRRYNVVVADVPFVPVLFTRDLLQRVHQRVLVMEPTLASLRGVLRLHEFAAGPAQTRRPILVLNRLGRPGGLTHRQVEDTLKMRVDVTIPDLPRPMAHAANLGHPLAASRGAFCDAMEKLARQVAFLRLLDGNTGSGGQRTQQRRRFGFWWRTNHP